MHEASIILSIMDIVSLNAKKEGALRVTKIVLTVGERSGVMPEALSFAFEALEKPPLLANAELEIKQHPLLVICSDCGKELQDENSYIFECSCGGTLNVISGQELLIEYFEIA